MVSALLSNNSGHVVYTPRASVTKLYNLVPPCEGLMLCAIMWQLFMGSNNKGSIVLAVAQHILLKPPNKLSTLLFYGGGLA